MPSAGLGERLTRHLGHGWATGCVVLILIAGAAFRINAYGDLRLSVATLDTQSYVDSARLPLLSWAAFSGGRPFTMNLLFRLSREPICETAALSMPAIGKESRRVIQDCFAPVVLLQAYLSILGWSVFVFSFSGLMTRGFTKIASAVLLVAVGFVPQVADWDSILTSEALTFSIFALMLGLALQLTGQSIRRESGRRAAHWMMLTSAATTIAAASWILVRDTNWYGVALLCLAAAPLLRREGPARRAIAPALVFILFVCGLSVVASGQSTRWHNSMRQAMDEYVLPYPARVATFRRLGMPSPDSPAYDGWFASRAPITYLAFLGVHPGFTATTVLGRLEPLFAENNQPYFKSPDLPLREAALVLGDQLHSKSTSTLVLDILIVLACLAAVKIHRDSWVRHMAAILCWLLGSAVCILVISFFADPTAVQRHVVFSLFLFRLVSWLGILVLVELGMRGNTMGPAA